MAARAMWIGNLKLGKASIGVKLYAAVEDAAVHFHLLHDRDHERLKQHMVNPETGEVRERGDIHRGLEVERGKFVLMTKQELDSLQPEPSRDIVIERFVPIEAIEPAWYERPYYLRPSGKGQDYFALARVLAEEQLAGLAHWVMRKRAYHGVLRAHGEHLLLSTLHSREQVLAAPKVRPEGRQGRASDERELAMAEQLVQALAGEFDPTQFRDEHRERVLALIAAKAKGKRLELPPKKRAPRARDLASALEQSLKRVQKRLPEKERLSA